MYSLLRAHSDCDRTFYCLKTMLIMIALKQRWNFTRQYSVPRTAKGQRDLLLSDRGTGAGLQCKQCPPLPLGWAGASCPSLLLLPGTCSRVCHSCEHPCKASTAAVGSAESCWNTTPSQDDPTLSCFHPTGELSWPAERAAGTFLTAPHLSLLWCLVPPGVQFAEGVSGIGVVFCS